LREISSKT